jgi:hypothetical protein
MGSGSVGEEGAGYRTSEGIDRRRTDTAGICRRAALNLGRLGLLRLHTITDTFTPLVASSAIVGSSVRGRLTVVVLLLTNLRPTGLLAAVVCDYAMINLENNWRWMVGMPTVLAVIQVFIVVAAPRSPYFLILKGHYEEAKSVLALLYVGGPDVVEAEFNEIKGKIEKLNKVSHKRVAKWKHRCCNGCSCLSSCPAAQKQVMAKAEGKAIAHRAVAVSVRFLLRLFSAQRQTCALPRHHSHRQ